MNTNFKFQNNTLFIFGIWDKTSIYKLKIKDFLALIQSKEKSHSSGIDCF